MCCDILAYRVEAGCGGRPVEGGPGVWWARAGTVRRFPAEDLHDVGGGAGIGCLRGLRGGQRRVQVPEVSIGSRGHGSAEPAAWVKVRPPLLSDHW